jgi:NADPH:quinone reductase-like Zn-dependent oxidoreductase
MTAQAVIQHQRNLVLAEVNVPQLQTSQVYVKVEFAAFNPTDSMFNYVPVLLHS